MNPHHPGGSGGRRCRPCLERLEDRYLPSVNFEVLGNTLVVFAPTTRSRAPAHVEILDNGTQAPNNVIAVAATPFFPAVTINNVVIQLSRDNDTVNYFLSGPLSGSRFVFANLATGTDLFQAVGSGGLLPGASLIFAVGGSPRHRGDTISGRFSGNVAPGASLSWNTFGSTGSNLLTFRLDGNVAAGGNVAVGQVAGPGSDLIRTDYSGLMNGALSLSELGGEGDDTLFADVEFKPGSTGTLAPSVVEGNGGDDDLTYLVHDPTHGAFIYNQILDGGRGVNFATRTSNVVAFNITVDDVVP
jgi:hypothetical protein